MSDMEKCCSSAQMTQCIVVDHPIPSLTRALQYEVKRLLLRAESDSVVYLSSLHKH